MTARSASVAFCAFGGQGVVPIDAGVDDWVRVVVVLDVHVDAPVRAVRPESIELLGDAGIESAMKSVISVGRVASAPAKTTWAEAIDDRGAPFDGTLAAGATRLRIEAWLTRHPRGLPSRAHVVLATDAGPIDASGDVAGEWPTG